MEKDLEKHGNSEKKQEIIEESRGEDGTSRLTLPQNSEAEENASIHILEYSTTNLDEYGRKSSYISDTSATPTSTTTSNNLNEPKKKKQVTKTVFLRILAASLTVICCLVTPIYVFTIHIDDTNTTISSPGTISYVNHTISYGNHTSVTTISRKMENQAKIPVLLDYGIGTFRFSTVLSKCLHLKSAPVEKYKEMNENQINRIDFFTTNTLCNIPPSLEYNQRYRVVLLLQNPITHMIETDSKKSFRSNSLTRSILCKMDGELTHQDLTNAKRFLKEKAHVGIFNHYMEAIAMFQKHFNWKNHNRDKDNDGTANTNTTLVHKCAKQYIQGFILQQASHYSDGNEKDMNIKRMHDLNFLDANIYSEYMAGSIDIDSSSWIATVSYIVLIACALNVYLYSKM